MTVAPQQGTQVSTAVGQRLGRLVLQSPKVGGHLTGQGLAYDTGGLRADALDRFQGFRRRAPVDLVVGHLHQYGGRGAKGADPIGLRAAALQQKRDPFQRLHGVHRVSFAPCRWIHRFPAVPPTVARSAMRGTPYGRVALR